ncbi:MAG: radical SAM protein [Desulfurococcales archaeon]|nr:radical SAM protein [Desulfurococcales archaeon]
MKPRKVLIIDGYNDEPGGLGVPPYIDVYPRYIAGALWYGDKSIKIRYITVDDFRTSKNWLVKANSYDMVVFISGVVVPGKYIGATPVTYEELIEWARIIRDPYKVLVGPAAKWGLGVSGGVKAHSPKEFRRAGFDVVVVGDVEEYFLDVARYGVEKASPYKTRSDYRLVDKVSVIGSRIIRQHPNYGRNLIVEIETYRGCSRWVSSGCSFCVEPLRGMPISRDPKAIVEEIDALYYWGARSFRLGRQADILVYGSRTLGYEEWPKPDPVALNRLFHGIRSVAPNLETLHIDNVNPGTIARYPSESVEALKVIIKYHTPGDVAAMGLETADPRVSKINNLNTYPEESLEAIRIINRIGSRRGYNGMPELLPGINFILGLPGETKETYRLNKEFLENVLREGLLVRRVNIRRIMIIPTTRASRMGAGIRRRHEHLARAFTRWVRQVFDREMLKRIAPRGTVLKGLWVEECNTTYCYARQTGSYPLMTLIPCRMPKGTYINDAYIIGVHSPRTVKAIPIPLSPKSSARILSKILDSHMADRLRGHDQGDLAAFRTRSMVSENGYLCL